MIDLKSANGTYVNKERIHSLRVIGDGDKIYVGDFVMKLLAGESAGDGTDMTAQNAPVEIRNTPGRDGVARRGDSSCEMGAPIVEMHRTMKPLEHDVDDIEIIEDFVEVEVEPMEDAETSSSDASNDPVFGDALAIEDADSVAEEVDFDLIDAEEIDDELLEVEAEDVDDALIEVEAMRLRLKKSSPPS